MKKLTKISKMLLLVLCLLSGIVTAQNPYENILIIHDALGIKESTVVIEVEMQNYQPIMGFQFDVPLPSGFSYVVGSATLNPLRRVDHIITANTLPGTNIFRAISGSFFSNLFLGNAGIVMSFTLNTPNQTGNYPFNLENCVMVNAVGSNVITGWVNGSVLIMQSLPALSGDANCNGSVNVIDVLSTINYILDNNPQPFCFENADVNADGNINVIDVINTVQIILN